ncbi:MAG: flagellar biosynthesis anti-sigma factor FlgM [Planctomycetota bacterium]
MHDISGINSRRIGRLDPAAPKAPARRADDAQSASRARDADVVQVSSTARFLEVLKKNPIREELVNRVKREIEAGTYETPEKMQSAIDEMMTDEGA